MSMEYREREYLQEKYWEDNMNTYEIAEECGVTASTIQTWMDRLGVDKREKGHTREGVDYTTDERLKDEDWLCERYIEEKLSTWEISQMVDSTTETVRNWLHKHDIDVRNFKKGIQVRRGTENLSDPVWLRDKYIKEGWSQKDIGDEIGVTAQSVNRWMKIHNIEGRTELGPNKGSELIEGDGPNWDEQSEKARKRDGFECADCGSKTGPNGIELDVHHTNPRGDFQDGDGDIDWKGANALDNLVTLCRSCHLSRHSI